MTEPTPLRILTTEELKTLSPKNRVWYLAERAAIDLQENTTRYAAQDAQRKAKTLNQS